MLWAKNHLEASYNRLEKSSTPTLFRTKIVCTLGPSSSSEQSILELMKRGMNVARLNFSHGDHDTHAKNIQLIRNLSERYGHPVAILQDLQGPKIRAGKLLDGKMHLENGQNVTLSYGLEQTDKTLPIDYNELAQDTHVGARILLDDGKMSMEVVEIKDQKVFCRVIYGGILTSRKGINFPDCALSIPSTTEKDIRDLLFGVSQNVDYVALSFVRTAEDVLKLKSMLRSLGQQIPVVSKIEMLQALEHLDELCQVSDAIMVARGDLGVECGFARVAFYQKKIIERSRLFGKPVIVATQMLESMITEPRPTKAEVCDVASAVYDRADAVMLSAESASGQHPALVVATMRDILNCAEQHETVLVRDRVKFDETSIREIFAQTAVHIASLRKAAAIVCLTLTGKMAVTLAKYRPLTPIIALSPRQDVVTKLSLVRGIWAIKNEMFFDTDHVLQDIAKNLLDKKIVKRGDLLIITAGIPLVQMLPTNLVKMHRIPSEDLQ